MIAAAGHSLAQEKELPEGVVPPPLSVLSDEESDSLEGETDLKRRTKLAIGFMESRLSSSEASADNEDFQESLQQLGHFEALMNNTYRNLYRNDYKKGALKNYKRFEIALREFIHRLELVRRALPFSHSYHVSELIKSVREVRRKSVDSFYGDTVLPDGQSRL
ncbi:MAG: hypothetical protein OEQ28_00730 [Acidobacteriota bacterium]|nr:hypothetical protein [Acidobacteriota bacterium]